MDAEQLAEEFDLGTPTGALVEAARGWGGQNVVHRLPTDRGTWAIKALHRELDDLTVERFAIEQGAYAGAIPMPRPMPARDGRPTATVDSTLVRCHTWEAGAVKANEETSVAEAGRMGELLAGLHGLSLAWSPRFDVVEAPEDPPDWVALARVGSARGAAWATTASQHLDELDHLSDVARRHRLARRDQPRVGSHRDLNAHNVLFANGSLSLIDWDAAGPVGPAAERASYASVWAARGNGAYDPDAAHAFLAGYRAAGGEVTADDPDTLETLIDDVAGWTEKNVRWAATAPSAEHDRGAALLVPGLLSVPAIIEERQRLLSAVIGRLLG